MAIDSASRLQHQDFARVEANGLPDCLRTRGYVSLDGFAAVASLAVCHINKACLLAFLESFLSNAYGNITPVWWGNRHANLWALCHNCGSLCDALGMGYGG